MEKLLEIKDLKVYFKLKGGLLCRGKTVYAVDNISFDAYKGEVLGIVGEVDGIAYVKISSLFFRILLHP